ncbi:unnamed protein product [Penicillium discolor]
MRTMRDSSIDQLALTEWPPTKAAEVALISPTPKSDIAKPLHLPCFLLNTHSANKDFCGSEDIPKHLATELLPPKNTVTASSTALKQFALCRLGGIGKTEIAREFARCHKDSFDAVFWVVADGIAELDHHYQQISLALGLEYLSECKSQVSGFRILENMYHDQMIPFNQAKIPMILTDYWPQGSGSILVTSRDPSSKGMFTRKPLGLYLGPLSQKDGLFLFNHLTTTSNELEVDTARKIVDALGGIPLAISRMADVIGEDLLEASVELLSDGASFKKSHYIEARTELLQSSLVQRDKQKQQISFHRIVQDVILTTMDVQRKRSLFDQVVRILWADWPSAMPKPSKEPELPQPKFSSNRLYVGRWAACAAIYPHVLRMHQLWSAISDFS